MLRIKVNAAKFPQQHPCRGGEFFGAILMSVFFDDLSFFSAFLVFLFDDMVVVESLTELSSCWSLAEEQERKVWSLWLNLEDEQEEEEEEERE